MNDAPRYKKFIVARHAKIGNHTLRPALEVIGEYDNIQEAGAKFMAEQGYKEKYEVYLFENLAIKYTFEKVES